MLFYTPYWSVVAKTQRDYLLLRKCDKGLCKDFKVIPSENNTVVMGAWGSSRDVDSM